MPMNETNKGLTTVFTMCRGGRTKTKKGATKYEKSPRRTGEPVPVYCRKHAHSGGVKWTHSHSGQDPQEAFGSSQ